MRVLITGGYGCIGAWIVKNLLGRGDSVWVYDLREDPKRFRWLMPDDQWRQAHFIAGDVTDPAGVRAAIDGHAINHVIHLAGLQVPTCRADPLLGARVNVSGTLAVFEAVKAAGDRVRRLVYASSAAVYGAPELYGDGPLGDDAPLKPSSHYGIFKVCNEGNARIYFEESGVSSIGLRPWTVYGVGRDFGMTSEPTKAILAAALGQSYAISYGGWQDLQYADDVAKAFVQCLDVNYSGANVYNLRGHVCAIAEFHAALCEVVPEARETITYGNRQLAIAYNLDDAAYRRDIGPVPRTPLVDGIRQTAERFRELVGRGLLDVVGLSQPAPVTAGALNEP